MIARFIIAILSLSIIGCSDDTDEQYIAQTGTVTIAELKSYYRGESHILVDDLTIEGQIVANDMMGEFSDRFILEDESGAIEISATLYDEDIQSTYKLGARLQLYCGQLWIGRDSGAIALGGAPDSDDPVGILSDDELEGRVSYLGDETPRGATELRVSEMSDTNRISTFVVVRSLTLANSDASTLDRRYCDIDSETGRHITTTHLFMDESGSEVDVTVPSTVDYADSIIPNERVDIYAILDYFAGRYYLRPIAMGVISQS